MGVKNHSGIVQKVRTWVNAHFELELKIYGPNGFLWHFAEDDNTTEIEQGMFYAPVYEADNEGKKERKTSHVFYILRERDGDGDTVFIEIGPDGFINPAAQPQERLLADLKNGDLVPLWCVSSREKAPEETISLLKKLQQQPDEPVRA